MVTRFDTQLTKPVLPTVSIALCTYNGAEYLRTQWQSLLDQHWLPNEVVVSDDCSSDDTPVLLKQLAAEAPFPVRILNNHKRLGYNKNFERVLAACTGDLIFICDQDDFWLPEKISVMAQYMADHPATSVLFCDAWVTDEHLQNRTKRFWEVVTFDRKNQARWQSGQVMDILLDGNRMMGCATVVRRDYMSTVLPIPAKIPGYIYDGWIALVAGSQHVIDYIDKPLQLYRTHVQQQIGVRPVEAQDRIRMRDRFTRHRKRKLAPLRKKHVQLTIISQLLNNRVPDTAPGLADVYRKLRHFTLRSHLPHNRLKRIVPVLTNLWRGNYRRYADVGSNWYGPLLAVLGDILE